MRIRYNPEARPELAAWEYYIDEPEKLRGHWAEQFARRQPMVLELGCGKGGFLAQMAPAHPEKNYIALDVKSEMLVLAKRKAEEAYAAAGVPMDNFLMTADEDVVEFLAYLVQVFVSQYFACFVGDDMVFLENIVWGKTEIIDKFHDGV